MTEAAGNGLPDHDAAWDRQVNTELAVIAAALDGGAEAIFSARALLQPDSFFLVNHQIVFDSMVSLAEQQVVPDRVTVCDDLERRGRLAMVGGRSGVIDIMDGFGTAANIPVYCRQLRLSAGRRRVERKADEIRHAARNGHGTDDLTKLALEVNEEAQRVASDGVETKTIDYVDFTGEALPVEWMVPGWLTRQDVAMMAGEAGVGKSTTLVALAVALAKGKAWCGIEIATPLRVMYFDEEQSLPEARRLFIRLGAPHENLRVAVGQGLSFSTPDGLALLEEQIRIFRPDVVFFDSLTHAFLGIRENNADEVGKVYNLAVHRLRRDYDLSFVFSHHLSKPPGDSRAKISYLQRVRGSTAHPAQCSTVWVAVALDGKLEVQQVKRRGAPQVGMRVAYSEAEDGTIELTGEQTMGEIIRAAKIRGEANREKIRAFVVTSGPVNRLEVQKATGFSKSTVCDHLSRLTDLGLVRVVFDGQRDLYSAPSPSTSSEASDLDDAGLKSSWEQMDYEKDA